MYNDSNYVGQTDELFGLGKAAKENRKAKREVKVAKKAAKVELIKAKAGAVAGATATDNAIASAVTSGGGAQGATDGGAAPADGATNWGLIGGIGAGVLVIIGVALFFVFKK